MAKKRTSAKPKAKQGQKITDPVVAEVAAVEVEQTADPDTAAATDNTPAPSRRASRLSRQQAKALSLEEEYAYVVKDLRRVFILAGIMFAGLIAVNLAFSLLGG